MGMQVKGKVVPIPMPDMIWKMALSFEGTNVSHDIGKTEEL
jgi:hypothetical protein